MLVGEYSWDRGVCWEKLGIVSLSGEQGVYNLMEIVGSLTSVVNICLRLQPGGTNHGAGTGAATSGRNN